MALRFHLQALVLFVILGCGGLYLIYAYNIFTDEPKETVAELTIELDEALLYGSSMTALLMLYALILYRARRRERLRQAVAMLKAQAASDTDPLTSLANRRRFDLVLGDRRRPSTPGTFDGVLLIDLNGFKQVNDTHGHAAGDEVLRVTASRIVGAVRDGDLVARIGGDEFAILAQSVSKTEAKAIAERILSAIAPPVTHGMTAFAVGAAIGISVVPSGSAGPAELVAADAAMYRAKRAGRSTFRLSTAALDFAPA